MNQRKGLPVALFNGTVATTNGLYRVSDIHIDQARAYIQELGYISAIGHGATAAIMSQLMGVDVPMNRIQFCQKVGQLAIVFKLNERPEEGKILTRRELESVGYSLKLMERIE